MTTPLTPHRVQLGTPSPEFGFSYKVEADEADDVFEVCQAMEGVLGRVRFHGTRPAVQAY